MCPTGLRVDDMTTCDTAKTALSVLVALLAVFAAWPWWRRRRCFSFFFRPGAPVGLAHVARQSTTAGLVAAALQYTVLQQHRESAAGHGSGVCVSAADCGVKRIVVLPRAASVSSSSSSEGQPITITAHAPRVFQTLRAAYGVDDCGFAESWSRLSGLAAPEPPDQHNNRRPCRGRRQRQRRPSQGGERTVGLAAKDGACSGGGDAPHSEALCSSRCSSLASPGSGLDAL